MRVLRARENKNDKKLCFRSEEVVYVRAKYLKCFAFNLYKLQELLQKKGFIYVVKLLLRGNNYVLMRKMQMYFDRLRKFQNS